MRIPSTTLDFLTNFLPENLKPVEKIEGKSIAKKKKKLMPRVLNPPELFALFSKINENSSNLRSIVAWNDEIKTTGDESDKNKGRVGVIVIVVEPGCVLP